MVTRGGFLNVDLEIAAHSSAVLLPLVDAFSNTLVELFRGSMLGLYRVHYEASGCGRDANETIHALAAAIDALGAVERRAWDAATLRDFNIGVELPEGVRSVELAIDLDAVRRVAALGGRIAFTAYQAAAMRQP